MVEPTIWPAWEGEKAEQGEECKTRQTYGRTNHLARLGRERRQKQGEECKTRRTYGRTNHLARLGGQRRRKQGEDCKTRLILGVCVLELSSGNHFTISGHRVLDL